MQQSRTDFSAPWSRQLRWLTGITIALLLGMPMVMLARAPEPMPTSYLVGIWLPPAVLAISVLFAIRGYRLEGISAQSPELKVLRMGWTTSISLAGLKSVQRDEKAMDKSLRVFGNGGLFGYIGLFRNGRLGRYRAFATDPARAIVLEYPDRKVVITPDNPQRFTQMLQSTVERSKQ